MSTLTPSHRPPKAMSSRLMTMKFMQRAAASSPPTTPKSQVQAPDTPPFKRQKTQASPSTASPASDLQLIQAALDDEEEKREKVVERLAEEAGETKWVLSTVNGESEEGKAAFRVTRAGYSDLDQEAWRPATVGRRSFGRFNQELERQNGTADEEPSSSSEEDSEASEDEDDEESDNPAGTRALIRASKEEAKQRALKAKRKAEVAELTSLAEKRRSKEVKLNRLSSISGGGGSAGKPTGGKRDRECFNCGENGHERRDCPRPQNGKWKNEAGDGSKSKRSRQSLDY